MSAIIDDDRRSELVDAVRLRVKRLRSRWLRPLNVITLALFLATLAGVYYRLTGEMDPFRALLLVAAPAGVAVALLRPGWMILGLLVMPPDTLATVTPRVLFVLVLGMLATMLMRESKLYIGWASGIWPIIAIVVLAMVFGKQIAGEGADVADGLLKTIQYYIALHLLAYNAVRLRVVKLSEVATALLAGGLVTAWLNQVGGPFSGTFTSSRNAAYLTAMGMLVAFGRLILGQRDAEGRPIVYGNILLVGILGIVTAGMLVRATWVAILLAFVLMAFWTTKTNWLVAIPLTAALVLAVPMSRERVVPDDLGTDIDLAEYTTGRWELWVALSEETAEGMPLGQGWAHWWSITPKDLFGNCSFVPQTSELLGTGECSQDYVYPHNDWLYLSVEQGIVGPSLLTLFWIHLFWAYRRLAKREGPTRDAAVVLVGAATVFLLVQLVDNGVALQPVSEKFFVIAGAVFGVHAAMTRDLGIDPDAPAMPAAAPFPQQLALPSGR